MVSESDQPLVVWSLNRGARPRTVHLGNRGFRLAASSSRIAVSIRPGTVRLYERADRNFQQEVLVNRVPSKLACSTAGTAPVVLNDSGRVEFTS